MKDQMTRKTCFILVLLLFFTSSVQSQSFCKDITSIELRNGRHSAEGNVWVTTRDGSRPLGDDSFGMIEANAVCVSLGFPRALTFTRGHYFGVNPNRRWTPDGWKSMYTLECSREEETTSAQDCCLLINDVTEATQSEVAGVVCQDKNENLQCESRDNFVCIDDMQGSTSMCIDQSRVCDGVSDCSGGSDESPDLCDTEGIFRLLSNLKTNLPGNTVAGTVYMKYNQTWSSICLRNFDEREAQVICRNLGYEGGISKPTFRAYLGQGFGEIRIDESFCNGDEMSLTQCPGFVWGDSDCGHFADAGVICHAGRLGVQLTGSSRNGYGRVEITSTGFSESYALCDKGFQDQDAQVVCRMLGFSGDGAQAIKGSTFGSSPAPVSNLILDCVGNETNIQDCRFKLNNEICFSRNAAAVSCLRKEKSVDELLSAVLPTACGVPVDSSDRFITSLGLIRGGRIPPQFDIPWLASIRVRSSIKPGNNHNCGAIVISEKYLLSAAHCFRNSGPLQSIVSVGEFNSQHDETFQQDFEIEKLYVHERFGELSPFDHDICLIKVKEVNGRGIRLGDRVKPVCLPRVNDSYNDLKSCIVAGWGRIAATVKEAQVLPRVARTGLVEDILCERAQGSDDVTSTQSCFFNSFQNPCRGDSGGPVSCVDSLGRHVLYGIVSYGAPCEVGVQVVDINTRIPNQLRWIQETIYRDLGMSFA